MKFKVNDTVKITAGKDKGRQGKITKVFPQNQRVTVEGINLYKRHVKPQGEGKPGGIIEVERPLPLAKIALICKKCNQPTRIGYRLTKTGTKTRICKKCQAEIN
jgi:large subunit ribosomal protein L24